MAGTANGKTQTMMNRSTQLMLGFLMLMVWAAAGTGEVSAESRPCGYGLSDWCPSTIPRDRCNRHTTKEACMADRRCYGIGYRGVSFVPCFLDRRGFPSNCPTVGCTSRRPPKHLIREGMICLDC
jgi:hypothetical protein